jgi:hypothetical protein
MADEVSWDVATVLFYLFYNLSLQKQVVSVYLLELMLRTALHLLP